MVIEKKGAHSSSYSPGEIIEMRSRLWRVDELKNNVLSATPIDGLVLEQQKFYVPFEDIKPGKLKLPDKDRVGNLAQQKLLLSAYKLDLLHSTAPILSLQKSRVIPEEYQLVPLIMSMDMPRVRLLIADDVGLGKTIEAGLIIKELLARNRARRVLVVCPANLRDQWKNALDYFFHLDARIISTKDRRAMERELPPGANPWEHFDLLIASIDYVKSDAVKNYVFEQEWDVVLIDEAHNCAKPHQSSRRQTIDMRRYEFARDISTRCKHLLLLTATPHNGYSDSYASLFSFLGEDLIVGEAHDPSIRKEKARNFVCQRRRKDVMDWVSQIGTRKSPFPTRKQKEDPIPLSQPHKFAIEKVGQFTKYLAAVADQDGKKYRKLMANWTVMHFHRRALSSPLALQRSLKNRIRKVKKRISEGDEEVGLSLSEAKAMTLDEDIGEKISEEEANVLLDTEEFGGQGSLSREIELLEEALEAAKKITPARDQKLKTLKQTLGNWLKVKPKVIIFTKYKDTLEYLEKELSKDKNLQKASVVTIHGEMNDGARREKFKDFRRARRGILVATDCISEGIDLQYMASKLIHYELPWNPNRLEQRNGRIDRYGQREDEVEVRLLVMEDSLDYSILSVLVKKAEQIRQDYGFSPPFFGDDTTVLDLLQEANLELPVTPQTSLSDFLGEKPVTQSFNPFSQETIQKIKGESFYGQTRLDLADVQERLEETKKLIGSSTEVRDFILSGLRRFGTEVKQHEADPGLFDFTIRDEGLLGPGVGKSMKSVCFDPSRAAKNPDLILIDLGHPLVRQLIEHIKISAFEDEERYGRTAYLSSGELEEVVAVYRLLVRYSVETTPRSILEEIVNVGVPVYGEGQIPEEILNRLLTLSPESGGERAEVAVRETLTDALGRDLEPIFNQVVEERKDLLVEERTKFRERFETEGAAEWVQGVDKVTVASRDLLTITLYYPVLGGF